MHEFLIEPAPIRSARGRPRSAAVASFVAHSLLVGVLWSAQIASWNTIRLAGGRGSVQLQATLAQPESDPTPLVERVLPTQVRVEPDHAHVDREMFVQPPEIVAPQPAEQAEMHRPEPHHDHPHPHEHTPALLESVTTPVAETRPTAAAEAAAAATVGHDETLPAPFFNPPPDYPAAARRAAAHGTVLLRIGVGVDGRVAFVDVLQSSGHAALDDAAVAAVRRWRFTPGLRNGAVAPFALRLPIEFRL